MKIWWPWRRKKSVLTLFEERVPCAYEDPNAPPLHFLPGTYEEPDRRNAAGPFYVVHGWCMGCGFPQTLAPDLIAPVEEQRDHHCYFKKQPETPEEIEQAIKAIAGSCCWAYRYAGTDDAVKRKLREVGAGGAIVND